MSGVRSVTAEEIAAFVGSDLLAGRLVEVYENILLTGLVDSLGVMTLVAHLETITNRSIPLEDVVLEHFESAQAIAAYLGARG